MGLATISNGGKQPVQHTAEGIVIAQKEALQKSPK
jgi:hypothetical protein